jgi:hypothetical protein
MDPSSYPLKKILLTVLFGLFSVPMIGFGAYMFVCWVRIHSSNVYYGDCSFAEAGLVWAGIALLSFGVTWYGAWRRSFYGLLFIIPVFLSLVSTHVMPNLTPRTTTLVADFEFIEKVSNSLREWYEKNERFPAGDSEFLEALAGRTNTKQYLAGPAVRSKYKQRGNSLPYEIVAVANAHGPRVANVSERPGVIYYCVSSDLQEFWVTMTGLDTDLGPTAFLRQLTWWEMKPWIHRTGSNYSVKQQ